MNGPGHYAEAERLIAAAEDASGVDGFVPVGYLDNLLNAAQVHSTLALVGAIVDTSVAGVSSRGTPLQFTYPLKAAEWDAVTT